MSPYCACSASTAGERSQSDSTKRAATCGHAARGCFAEHAFHGTVHASCRAFVLLPNEERHAARSCDAAHPAAIHMADAASLQDASRVRCVACGAAASHLTRLLGCKHPGFAHRRPPLLLTSPAEHANEQKDVRRAAGSTLLNSRNVSARLSMATASRGAEACRLSLFRCVDANWVMPAAVASPHSCLL